MILKSMTGGVNKKKRIFKYFICCLLIVFILLTIHDKKQKCNSDITTSSKSPNKHNNNKTSFYCWFLATGTSTVSSQQTSRTEAFYREILRNTKKYIPVVNEENREQQGSLDKSLQESADGIVTPTKGSVYSLLITKGMSESNAKDSEDKVIKKDPYELNSKQNHRTTKQQTQTPGKTTKSTKTTSAKPTAAKPTISPTTATIKPATTTTTTKPTISSSTTTTTKPTTTKTPANVTPKITSTSSEARLRCHIPKLDPFHREVTPYVRWSWLNETCKIKQSQSRVENGKLFVYIGESSAQMGKVEEITLHYMKRVNDYLATLTSQIIYKRNKNETSDEKGKKMILYN